MAEIDVTELTEEVGQGMTAILLLAAGAARSSDRERVRGALGDIEATARAVLGLLTLS
jgi:signal transduction histidine kinase